MTYINSQLYSNVIKMWQTQWNNDKTGRQCYKFIPNIKDFNNNKCYKTNYHITQLFTGHGHFNSYFARFRIKDNDKCDCGVTGKQYYYHLIYDCDHYNNQWDKLMQTVTNEGLNWPCLEKDYIYNKTVYIALKQFLSSMKALDNDTYCNRYSNNDN